MATFLGLGMLALGGMVVSCNRAEEPERPANSIDSGADTTKIPEIPSMPDTEPKGEVPQVPVGENTVTVTSAELLRLIVSGEITANGDYAVTDGEGISFDRAQNGKEFDLKNALIRIGVRENEVGVDIKSKTLSLKNARIAVYGGTAVAVSSDTSNTTLQNIHVGGNCITGFSLGGNGSTLDACTVKPAEGGSVQTAVITAGSNVMVQNCAFGGVGVGVSDRSATGAAVWNDLFTDCRTAVSAETANTAIMNNTVNGGTVGIAAKDDGGEISACMGNVYNVLVAQNTVAGAETAILLDGVSNCAVLMNTADMLTVRNCVNVYIMNNRAAGNLTLEQNNYIISDSNVFGKLKENGNTNTNGGDLTDLSERANVGANEKLLPHINADQFAGMKGRSSFRSKYGVLDIYDYIKAALAAGETDIIIPPGAHINSGMTFNGLKNIRIYGYGVYNDTIKSTTDAFYFESCEGVELYGFFIGNSINPNLQGTVVAVTGNPGKETISFVADPGYLANYTVASNFPATNGGGGGIYRADSQYPYSEIWYEHSSKKYDGATQVNTIMLIQDGIKYGRLPVSGMTANPMAVGSIQVGDRVAFRNYKGARGIGMKYCSGMKIEDVTVYCSSGFAFSDYQSDVASSLHRCAVTSGPAPVIDQIVNTQELAVVNDANRNVTWTDSYGRLRSAYYLNTSCDATHCSDARTGMQAVSCLLENMMDDGGNINAHSGLGVSYDAATRTLTYRGDPVGNYNVRPGDFRVGDTILLYTRDGRNIGSTTITEKTQLTVPGETENTRRYTVKLADHMTFPEDMSTVIVQNASASGSGFLWDNVMVRNNNSVGVRISATGGEIKNCSFVGLAKAGIGMNGPSSNFPECGYGRDVKITNNLFEELSIMGAQWYYWDSTENGSTFSPISICGPGKDSSDADRCMYLNITITGNYFASRYAYYDMVFNGVQNLTVTGNTFAGRKGMEQSDTQANILIRGGNGIVVDGNTFPDREGADVIIKDGTVENVTGSDAG